MTQKYALFLRGMNLGKRRITNEALIAALAELGFPGVVAYQASGNLVLSSGKRFDTVRGAVEKGLPRLLGYQVPVFIRSRADLEELLAAKAFTRRATEETRDRSGKIQVIFLDKEISPADAAGLADLQSDDDWLEARGREILWWPRLGVAGSELSFRGLESLMGGTTVRTLGTVERMFAKFF